MSRIYVLLSLLCPHCSMLGAGWIRAQTVNDGYAYVRSTMVLMAQRLHSVCFGSFSRRVAAACSQGLSAH